MPSLAALSQLGACLRGRIPNNPDWPGIVELANRGLITPQWRQILLEANLTRGVPQPLADFAGLTHELNQARNVRLGEQLREALIALNGAGVTPTLLKGAALWATMPGSSVAAARMLSDIDLLVTPSEVEAAVEALRAAGFPLLRRYVGPDVHAVAEFGRPEDVGCIDLHQRPPGPVGLVEAANLDEGSLEVDWRGGRARRYDPASQIFCLVLHDQFHDGGYWRGGFDLRHLLDIALLSRSPGGVDWHRLHALFAHGLLRTVLETELLAATNLAGAAIPEALTRRVWVGLHHVRHLAQFAWPTASPALAAIAALSEWRGLLSHRAEDRSGRRRVLGQAHESPSLGFSRRVGRLQHILSARPGKV
jgi:hypothetical protein